VIFGLLDGRVVESGTHDSPLAPDGLYARLYVEQFSRADRRPPPYDERRADVPL